MLSRNFKTPPQNLIVIRNTIAMRKLWKSSKKKNLSQLPIANGKPAEDYTTNEVMMFVHGRMPENEDDLNEIHEIVRINMIASHPDTLEYRLRARYLRSVEFKLQGINNRKVNVRMFRIALVGVVAISLLALLSLLIHN